MIKKTMIICLMAVMGVITASAQSVYDFKVKDDAGSDVSLVMVTHSPEAAAICDRVLALENGVLK